MNCVKDENTRVQVEDGETIRRWQHFYEKNAKKPLREVCASKNFTRPIIRVETVIVLKMMKCGKVVRPECVQIKAFKTLSHEGVVTITNFFSFIFHTGKRPNE